MFKLRTKYPIYDQQSPMLILRTQVVISSQHIDGEDTITRSLEGDVMNKSDDELVRKVLESFYYDTFPGRVEREEFDKIEERFKENEKLIEESNNQTEMFNMALFELAEQVYPMVEKLGVILDGNDTEPTNTIEGGEINDGNVDGN